MSGDGEYRKMTAEERELYDEFSRHAEGRNGDVVINVCLCLLADLWRSRPDDKRDADPSWFVRLCSDQLRLSLELPADGRSH